MQSHLITAALLALAPAAALAAGDVRHVPGQYGTIQAAIDASAPGDTVLVAPGLYTGDGNRDLDFNGKDIVVKSVAGAAATVLDAGGTPQAPFRAVLFQSGETRAAVLKGFTITGGATPPGAIADVFNGAGVFIASSSPTIRDCVFVGNHAGCWGGGVYVAYSGASPLIDRCHFVNNLVDDDGGGLFTWSGASPTVTNSVFLDNVAQTSGGAIAAFGGGLLTVENVTMVGNSASVGGAMYSFGTDVTNSIVWGNGPNPISGSGTVVSYSVVEGGYPGHNVFDVDPRLMPDRIHLRAGSPCLDVGGPGLVGLNKLDVDGEPRVQGAGVDVGADERRPLPPAIGEVDRP